MKLEEATCENTCQYCLTGMVLRVKLLWVMKCNPAYAIFAVELGDKIYKAYVWNSDNPPTKIGKIFYVKFGSFGPGHMYGHYSYKVCDKDGNFDKEYPSSYLKSFEPEYNNVYDIKDSYADYDSDEDNDG